MVYNVGEINITEIKAFLIHTFLKTTLHKSFEIIVDTGFRTKLSSPQYFFNGSNNFFFIFWERPAITQKI